MIPETVVRRANARGPLIVSAICSELREILNDRVPNDLQVDAEVRVNEHIALPGDVLPVRSGVGHSRRGASFLYLAWATGKVTHPA
jgi:hypothetical protein